ncbi:STAS domain-containing protein [Pontibacter qinzhouensis]|uniref:Anti-sigma factor antagonist n=1 Tax=Pontibacter qinzhouensis TaxID=2603253 RepID=A0A5C8JIN9_9BACT|nr:STAS domain-containing protein [Pontibacter qinzhouensis]TXK36417.1 STAS domain-containing protein [Pontibacter qinzhouensis]
MKTFDISYTALDDVLFISIEGELDARTCVKAHYGFQRIDISKTRAIVIDCNDLSYVSSAGIGVLLSIYHACLQNGTLLILHGLQPKVRNVLEILGLEKVLLLKETFEEALEVVKEKIPA